MPPTELARGSDKWLLCAQPALVDKWRTAVGGVASAFNVLLWQTAKTRKKKTGQGRLIA